MDYEALQRKVEQYNLPPFLCKSLAFSSQALYAVLRGVNSFYKYPEIDIISTPFSPQIRAELERKYIQENAKLEWMESKGVPFQYVYDRDADWKLDLGDQCLWGAMGLAYKYYDFFMNELGLTGNGIRAMYSAQEKIFPAIRTFLETYIVEKVVDGKTKYYLLRGVDPRTGMFAEDPSGDQLMGMVFMLSFTGILLNHGRRQALLPRFQGLIDTMIADNYTLMNYTSQTPSQHGRFNPNIIKALFHGGAASVVCAALLVAERREQFNYLWNTCGYKYIARNPAPYLWDNGVWKFGQRAWFADHIAFLAHYVIFDEYLDGEDSFRVLQQLLDNNPHNYFFAMLFRNLDIVSRRTCYRAQEYLATWVTGACIGENKHQKYYPLSTVNPDFVWQRSPFGPEPSTKIHGRMDVCFAYLLGKRYDTWLQLHK